MTTTVALIVFCMVAGMLLVLAELLTPSFGLIASLALAAFGGAIWLSFGISATLGWTMLVTVLVGLPFYLWFLVRALPHLPGGRSLFLKQTPVSTATGAPDAELHKAMIGKIGTAETMLRPGGAVRIEGRRVDAQAEGGMIEAGETVKVVAADMANVIVRRVTKE